MYLLLLFICIFTTQTVVSVSFTLIYKIKTWIIVKGNITIGRRIGILSI